MGCSAAHAGLIAKTVDKRLSRWRLRTVRTNGTNQEATFDVRVVGRGPTGLSAAYHLAKTALLLEQKIRSAVVPFHRGQWIHIRYAGNHVLE